MTTEKLLITPDLKIYDMLKAYPELEGKLIEIAPVFVKLKNPVLRRTITRVTNLKQAAVVGKVGISELINKLRIAVGQGNTELINEKTDSGNKPEWVEKSALNIVYDAREDLESGVHPVNKVISEASLLQEGEVYKLITPFMPAPLIDMLASKGFDVYSEEPEPGKVDTYIKKQSLS